MTKHPDARESPTFLREEELHRNGIRWIAGVDEAGRGPLAGPVVAAAVIFPETIDPYLLEGIRDSKQLSEKAREQFYEKIIHTAEAYAVGQATAREIETINIRQASLLAMKRAVEKLPIPPEYVLIDGKDYPEIPFPGEAIIRGDQKCITVGAASIVAKVVRDRIMVSLHTRFPPYGFDQHKGYPTEYHRIALELFGACEQHRTTYTGVSEHILISECTPPFRESLRRLEKCRNSNAVEQFQEEFTQSHNFLAANERFYLLQRAAFRLEELSRRERFFHPASVDLGGNCESLAADYLMSKGYELWERNYRCREGEIDLIMNQGSTIIFVEVKSRRSLKYGNPIEAVTRRKMKAITRTADHYLYERGFLEDWDIRYDGVAVVLTAGRPPEIEHYEDLFRAEDIYGIWRE